MNLPINTPAPKYDMSQAKEMMLGLTTCPIKNSGVRVVLPAGDGSSGVMIIGEAPGAKEDQIGEPFVGASGRFLNTKLLPSVGLTRENIYLTNIVKCRPPENRDPTEIEKEAWSGVLMAEIVALKPKLILCLGRHSLSFFDAKLKIGEVHGKVQKVRLYQDLEVVILPMYHPAVALYNGSRAPILVEDFGVVSKFLGDNFDPNKVDFEIKKPETNELKTKVKKENKKSTKPALNSQNNLKSILPVNLQEGLF